MTINLDGCRGLGRTVDCQDNPRYVIELLLNANNEFADKLATLTAQIPSIQNSISSSIGSMGDTTPSIPNVESNVSMMDYAYGFIEGFVSQMDYLIPYSSGWYMHEWVTGSGQGSFRKYFQSSGIDRKLSALNSQISMAESK